MGPLQTDFGRAEVDHVVVAGNISTMWINLLQKGLVFPYVGLTLVCISRCPNVIIALIKHFRLHLDLFSLICCKGCA